MPCKPSSPRRQGAWGKAAASSVVLPAPASPSSSKAGAVLRRRRWCSAARAGGCGAAGGSAGAAWAWRLLRSQRRCRACAVSAHHCARLSWPARRQPCGQLAVSSGGRSAAAAVCQTVRSVGSTRRSCGPSACRPSGTPHWASKARARCRLMRRWCIASDGVASGQNSVANCSRCSQPSLAPSTRIRAPGRVDGRRRGGSPSGAHAGVLSKQSMSGAECRRTSCRLHLAG